MARKKRGCRTVAQVKAVAYSKCGKGNRACISREIRKGMHKLGYRSKGKK